MTQPMITSRQNPLIKQVRSLLSSRPKDRRVAGAYAVEGVRLVEEALRSCRPAIEVVLYRPNLGGRASRLIGQLQQAGVRTEAVADEVFQSLGEGGSSQGVIAVLAETPAAGPDGSLILVPDAIRDPGNLGSLLRSADAAGFSAAWLPPETADAFAPKVVRAGMGAHFRLPIRRLDWDEIAERSAGRTICLADMHGSLLCWQAPLLPPLILIIGGEAAGATASARRLATLNVHIPMPGPAESLNAAAAGAVLMFEVVRQMQAG